MYELHEISARIKQQAKSQNIPMKEMLRSCGLGINAVSEMAKGKAMSCIALGRIAEYLSCSADYLMGRTDIADIAHLPENIAILSPDEFVLIERYRAATDEGKEIIRGRALEQKQVANLEKGKDSTSALA